MIVTFIDDESAYAAAFAQTGYGMPRYRGSPMMGGIFWGRIISFAKGLFSKAALTYLTLYHKLNRTPNDQLHKPLTQLSSLQLQASPTS